MKKYVLVLALLFGFTAIAMAQPRKRPHPRKHHHPRHHRHVAHRPVHH